eukprot:gene7900-689_t
MSVFMQLLFIEWYPVLNRKIKLCYPRRGFFTSDPHLLLGLSRAVTRHPLADTPVGPRSPVPSTLLSSSSYDTPEEAELEDEDDEVIEEDEEEDEDEDEDEDEEQEEEQLE